MAGVFGAGVAAGLIETEFERNFDIEAMYGGSAGVFTEAYYASRQPFPIGPSIYWDNLSRDFILGKNIPFGTFQRFCCRCFGCYPGRLVHAINIDLVMDIVSSGKKALDIATLKACPFPVYIKLFDVKNKNWVFVDIRTYPNPLRLVKAAISMAPYYFSSENIYGSDCLDLCLADTLNLDLIASKHPGSRIVFIVNYNVDRKAGLLLKAVRLAEGVVANFCFKEIDRVCFVKGVYKFQQDVKGIKANPDMLLIYPSKKEEIKAFTTDPRKLKRVYEIGKQEAQKIVDFAKRQ